MVKCHDLPRVISDSDWSWLIQIAYKFLVLQLFVTNYPAMFGVFQTPRCQRCQAMCFVFTANTTMSCLETSKSFMRFCKDFHVWNWVRKWQGNGGGNANAVYFSVKGSGFGGYFLDFISVCQRVKKNAWRNQLQLLPLSILNWTISNPRDLQSCFFFQKQQFDDSCSTSTWMFCWNRGDTDSVHRWYDLIWL